MATVLAAASYPRIGFSLYLAVHARRVRVPGGSKFHLEPGTIPWSNFTHITCYYNIITLAYARFSCDVVC